MRWSAEDCEQIKVSSSVLFCANGAGLAPGFDLWKESALGNAGERPPVM
jgi:hypothetical protein